MPSLYTYFTCLIPSHLNPLSILFPNSIRQSSTTASQSRPKITRSGKCISPSPHADVEVINHWPAYIRRPNQLVTQLSAGAGHFGGWFSEDRTLSPMRWRFRAAERMCFHSVSFKGFPYLSCSCFVLILESTLEQIFLSVSSFVEMDDARKVW